MKIHICEDGGSYGPKSGYNYWSAWEETENGGKSLNFASTAGTENQMRKIVQKWWPDAEIVVEPSKIRRQHENP